MNDSETARYLIQNNKYMTIATADGDGKPWVSPVYFRHDDQFNLYWVSDKDALHSLNIRNRPAVGIVIFGPTPPTDSYDGLYLDCIAQELNDDSEIRAAMMVLNQGKQEDKFMIKSFDDVTGKAAWRIYKATPQEVTKRADAISEQSGQAITIRKAVDLSV